MSKKQIALSVLLLLGLSVTGLTDPHQKAYKNLANSEAAQYLSYTDAGWVNTPTTSSSSSAAAIVKTPTTLSTATGASYVTTNTALFDEDCIVPLTTTTGNPAPIIVTTPVANTPVIVPVKTGTTTLEEDCTLVLNPTVVTTKPVATAPTITTILEDCPPTSTITVTPVASTPIKTGVTTTPVVVSTPTVVKSSGFKFVAATAATQSVTQDCNPTTTGILTNPPKVVTVVPVTTGGLIDCVVPVIKVPTTTTPVITTGSGQTLTNCNCELVWSEINAQKAALGYLELDLEAKWNYMTGQQAQIEVALTQFATLSQQLIAAIETLQGKVASLENDQNSGSGSNSYCIEDTLDYIQANGIMVSNRWRIGEEPGSGGNLVIRDEYASLILGQDSRYVLASGATKTL